MYKLRLENSNSINLYNIKIGLKKTTLFFDTHLLTELEHCALSSPYKFRLNDLTYYLGSFSSDFIYFSTILEKTELFF